MFYKWLKWCVLCILAGLGSISTADIDPNYKIILLTENFPPYNMSVNDKNFARDNNIDGISADIVREMFKRAGIRYSLTLRFPWDRIFNLTREKSNYGLFSTVRNADREKMFKWVGPIAQFDSVFLAKDSSSIVITTLEDAKKYRVGGYEGDATANFLQKRGFELILSLKDNQNAKKLDQGKIDLWATGDPSGRYLAQQEGIRNLKKVYTFNTSDLYLALNPEVPDEVTKKLQSALEEMRKEGFIEETINSYL
ncbi:ABC transporter substrate-binding protein [Zooshikella marina]|uniref:substrate-binding periplasmic protein n=1 Tax=Zooshikella ganghwensis TaxID=202772 RepID=UPI001BB03042|nr:ABC transporter substrate-binding protein [Zooshikella ganghwensis]MBU2707178.1 ABC transporter substrate-binding protein [Zooshikella ganghwensis]